MATSERAQAKINLALHVTGQRDDGYHLLDSLVVFGDCADRITLRPAERTRLRVSGPFAKSLPAAGDNIMLRALSLFGPDMAADIDLEKNLPVAAGIGGGSADAAAVLRAVARAFGVSMPAMADVLTLGADVPVCLAGQTARMEGIGERLTPLVLPALNAVLVNPGVAVATGPVFAALTRKANPPIEMAAGTFSTFADTVGWLKTLRNDLQPGAIVQAPVIKDVLASLIGAGAGLVRMSGSGATCFGLFGNAGAAERAAERLAAAHPDWWVRATVFQAARDNT